MGGRTSWGIAKKLTTVSQNNSSVMTWDSYPSVADALDALDYPLEGYVSPKGDKTAEANPWGATTLDWTDTTSPPLGHGNFETVPSVYRGPYEYSVPKATKDFIPQSEKG